MAQADGGSAFPHHHCSYFGAGDDPSGMTLRDYFAAKALQGLITTPGRKDDLTIYSTAHTLQDNLARIAYELADAMLLARQEQG